MSDKNENSIRQQQKANECLTSQVNDIYFMSSANCKEEEKEEYAVVMEQFDDLISELSNSRNNINCNFKQPESLFDVILENVKNGENSSKIINVPINNMNKSLYSLENGQEKNHYVQTKENNILSENKTKSDDSVFNSECEKFKVSSNCVVSSKVTDQVLSKSAENVLWINSQLWQTELPMHSKSAQIPTSYQIKQNIPSENCIYNPKLNITNLVKSTANTFNSSSFVSTVSYLSSDIKYVSNNKSVEHLPSVSCQKASDSSINFQKEGKVKPNFWTYDSSVEQLPRLPRSFGYRNISNDKCFLQLFIETKDLHLGPFAFEIYSRMSLWLLKLKVEQEYGIISSSQRWILGKTFAIDNEKSLIDYNVIPGSSIILYVDGKYNNFSNSVKKEDCIKHINAYHIAETSITDKNKKINMPATVQNKSAYTEVKISNKKNSSNYSNYELNLKVDNLCARNESHDHLIESLKTYPTLYFDNISDNIETPSTHKKKINKTLQSNKAKHKVSDAKNFNYNAEKCIAKTRKADNKQNSNTEGNLLDHCQSNENIMEHNASQSSVLEDLFDETYQQKIVKNTRHLFQGKKQDTLLKMDEKNNSFNDLKNYQNEQEQNIKGISTRNLYASFIKVDSENLNYINTEESKIQSNLSNVERSENYDCETCSHEMKSAPNSNQLKPSFLKKLMLSNKAKLDDSNIESPNLAYTPETTDEKSSDLCTSFNDQAIYTDVHIEISQDPNTVQNGNKLDVVFNKNSLVQDSESIRNFQLLQEIENMDLVENTTNFTCPVCFDSFDSGQGVVLHDCLHTFCRECLINSIIHANGALVKCPYRDDFYSCESHLQQREIKALVSEEVYEKYLQRSIITAEGLAERSFHCKTLNCPGWCIYEDVLNVFKCPVCFHYNCLNCQAIHEGLNCRQYQDKLKVQEKIDHDAEKTLEFLNKMIENGKALRCPKCNLILMKRWGCDWLKCSICQTEICWVTKGPRWGPDGQGDISGGCRCGVNGIKCHPSCNYCH